MAPLSEKARGKQRADDVNARDAMALTSQPSLRMVTIRFTEGVQDLILYVGENDSVRDIKVKIKDERVEISNRRLRMIYSGRLLTDGTLLYPLLATYEEQRRESVESERAASKERSGQMNTATWLHCSVGPVIAVGDDETDDETAQTSQIRPLRGFDRLQAAGFSEEDIASIRRQFHGDASNAPAEGDIADDDLDEHARSLEEQWIDSIDSTGSAVLSQSPSSTSSLILQGLLLGFFFPILPFFFFREPRPAIFWEDGRESERVPSVIFSFVFLVLAGITMWLILCGDRKRMQMGIVIGFILNLTFGLWRYLLS